MSFKETPTGDCHRITSLWFDDGDVVIKAGRALFRVSKAELALGSSTFRDMFTDAQPDKEECLDDCPMVTVAESEDDMQHFLSAIRDPGLRFEGKSFAFVSAVLRLSTKYFADKLRSRVIQFLEPMYPTTLATFTSRRISGWPHISVILLARKAHVPWILPAAMYIVCMYSAAHENIGKGYKYNGHHFVLEDDDKITCIRALSILGVEYTGGLTRTMSGYCCNKGDCGTAKLRVLRGQAFVRYDYDRDLLRKDPYRRWLQYLETNAQHACSSCLREAKEQVDRVQEDLWRRLPEIFRLQSWDELMKSASEDRVGV